MIDSALTAALVGVIIVLTRVIEHLLAKRAEARKPAASPYNGHTDKICVAADKLHDAAIKIDITAERLERAVEKMER